MVACFCFVVYAITSPIGVMLDLLFWNVVMGLLNARHAVALLYERRHIDFPPELNQSYLQVFGEFMRRTDFAHLAKVLF